MKTVGLPLTSAERKLLCDEVIPSLNHVGRIEATAAEAEVQFTFDELEELHGQIAFDANHAKTRERQNALDAILRKIERLQEEERKPPALRIHDPDRPSIPTADEMAADMEKVLAELEFVAASLGVNVEELSERVMPTQIGPDDKLPVILVAEDRGLLLALDGLDEQTRQAMQAVGGKRRKVELTLSQIDQLARLANKRIETVSDKRAERRWSDIQRKLEEQLGRYYVEDASNALERMAAGEDVPPALALRELWGKLLERRRGK